jgi:regulator of PEP synthase PpsR (kinase-PPPase family)
MGSETRYIDVLSDSTGETAERVVRAALLQFPQADVVIRRHARVRTPERAQPVIARAAEDRALFIFSVVSPELSQFIQRTVFELGLEAIDVIGSVIGRLEVFLGEQPLNRPGALMPLGEEYYRRIEAMEFMVRSDAGRDPKSLLTADVILVGVSRTSKTPVATLLAQRGIKVANLTLVLGRGLPSELEHASQDRVVAFTIDVGRLCSIRQDRLRMLGMPSETLYGVRDHVQREIDYADMVFRAHPSWPTVDISARSVEETAAIVLELMGERLPGVRTRSSGIMSIPPPARS